MQITKARMQILLLCVLPIVTLIGTHSTFSVAQEPNEDIRLSLPSRWVPFSADLAIKTMRGDQQGRYYRASNGSTATVLKSAGGALITIDNVSKLRRYVHFPNRGWIEYEISQAALSPPKSQLLLSQYTRKLPQKIAGGDVYELSASNRRVVRIAAGLNGTTIYAIEANGLGKEYTNIVVGEPPADVFVPPDGVRVEIRRVEDMLPSDVARTYKPVR